MMIFLKVLVDNYIKYNIQTCYNVCFQSSKDLLLQFSRDFLSGEGDITRHLGYLGYKTTYTQTALDEFDFAVKNLATDLRDGVRLTYIHLKLYFQSMMFWRNFQMDVKSLFWLDVASRFGFVQLFSKFELYQVHLFTWCTYSWGTNFLYI